MTPADLTADLLRTMPLPRPEGGSKEGRGRVLVVAGSVEVPGAALLAADAALRVGAGKLQVATVRSAAVSLALAAPEAMVIGLDETPDGGIDPDRGSERLCAAAEKVDAVLVGCGMVEGEAAASLTRELCGAETAMVLDAASLCDLRPHAEAIRSHRGGLVITPHAGEMAQLLDMTREEVEADPLGAARAASNLLDAVVVMKGAQTHVVDPGGGSWLFGGGGVGLATSGSGDVLGGIVAGLLARGADPTRATLWGVFLHGEAGRRLGQRDGEIGFLARHLSAELPSIMDRLSNPG